MSITPCISNLSKTTSKPKISPKSDSGIEDTYAEIKSMTCEILSNNNLYTGNPVIPLYYNRPPSPIIRPPKTPNRNINEQTTQV